MQTPLKGIAIDPVHYFILLPIHYFNITTQLLLSFYLSITILRHICFFVTTIVITSLLFYYYYCITLCLPHDYFITPCHYYTVSFERNYYCITSNTTFVLYYKTQLLIITAITTITHSHHLGDVGATAGVDAASPLRRERESERRVDVSGPRALVRESEWRGVWPRRLDGDAAAGRF